LLERHIKKHTSPLQKQCRNNNKKTKGGHGVKTTKKTQPTKNKTRGVQKKPHRGNTPTRPQATQQARTHFLGGGGQWPARGGIGGGTAMLRERGGLWGDQQRPPSRLAFEPRGDYPAGPGGGNWGGDSPGPLADYPTWQTVGGPWAFGHPYQPSPSAHQKRLHGRGRGGGPGHSRPHPAGGESFKCRWNGGKWGALRPGGLGCGNFMHTNTPGFTHQR